jgi:hypothetical protein
MRKFYSLLASLVLVLLCLQTNAQIVADSCRADFERVPTTTIDLLTAGFRALPWINADKKPEEICWSFGDNHDTCLKYDPALSNNYFIAHTYEHTGTYNVCVRILYQGGCLAYKCRYVQIGDSDSCAVKFETLNSAGSLLGKYFIAHPWNNHNKKPVLVCWNFGDNRDTCIQYSTSYTGAYAVFHSYSHSDNYNVCVKILFDGGCEAHYCQTVQVGELRDSCTADFERMLTPVNYPLRTYYRALPWHNNNKKPEQICWSFGDNSDTCINYNTAIDNNYVVGHTYANAGTYNVCVKILYQGGCASYKCKVVQIGEPDSCKVSFETVSSTSNQLGKYFIAQPWHNHDKKPVQVCWNFGDNHDTCIQYSTSYTGRYAAFHSYLHTGTYNVCVKIRYDGGCESYSCHSVQVGELDSCRADFETLLTTNNVLRAYYRALPWHNNNKKPEQICWNFGDNHDTCINYNTAIDNNYVVGHTYAMPGTYNVCVRIKYQGGCVSYKCKLVQIGQPDSCKVSFETLSSTSNRLGRYFIAKPSHNHNKKPVLVCWNFGDNHDTCIQYSTSYTGPYAVFHSYAHAGNYNVCVKVRFDGGCESYSCHVVEVSEPDSCRADFETLLTTNNVLRAYYRALPWHNNNKKPEQICWNFGDNHDTCINYNTAIDNNYVVGHTYANAGTYNVCVRIKYQGGCVSYKCKLVQIGQPDSCKVSFETLSSASNKLGKYFIAKPWHNHNKKPVLVCWNFGDNHDTCIQYSTSYTGPYAVFHSYAHAGNYNVCVKVRFDGGCESYSCHLVEVSEPDSCRADFERIPVSTANDALRVYYRALPWNNHEKKPARICWIFGDGKDTCISYPENYTGTYVVGHHYEHSGIYEVCVKILYYGGCEAKKCKIVNIFLYNNECRIKLYEIVPSVTSLTRGFYFVSSNDNRPARVCWNFGDGNDTCITVEPNATEIPHAIKHTYPGPGVYRACVKVLFANGCTASDCVEVVIRSVTDICGGYYTDSLIDDRTYAFKAYSIHKPDDAVLSYKWTFGDGSSGDGEKITHTYNVAGVYRVCLLIRTEKGCETRICNDVRVAGPTQSRLQLTPNPVINTLHAVFYSTHTETVKIKIINSNGAVIREYTRPAVVGLNTWEFDLSGLLPGVYSFVVQSSNQFVSGIFFKQ